MSNRLKKLLDALFHPMTYLVAGLIRLFPLWEFLGFHITRNHFYSPIPDTRELKDSLWERQSELVGLDLQDQTQLDLLNLLSARFKGEYAALQRRITPEKNHRVNSPFSPVDSAMLYYMVRYFHPARIIEIGAGSSTLVSAQALIRNEQVSGKKSNLIAIEPYPNETLKRGFPGLTMLIAKKVEQVDMAYFTALQENDILFIDSSHVLKNRQ